MDVIVMPSNEFWKGKRVLITGHTGFKGSWLSIWLLELGAQVIGYALEPSTAKDNFVLSKLKNKITHITGDVRDYSKLYSTVLQYRPEYVFHLAAQPLVRRSYEIPKETYEVNVMGTLNVLECIRNCKSIKTGIIITTDKCYENREQVWGYRENDPMGGYDPYSSSKACCELLISSWRNSFFNTSTLKNHGKSIASVRAGNVIGGGDWCADRLVPDCIRAIENNEVIKIRNKASIRPWQHVLEPLGGYILLAEKLTLDPLKYSGGWNFGPDLSSVITVKDLAEKLVNEYGSGTISEETDNCVHEANLLTLDISKAKLLLEWSPKLNIDETIKLTVDWYKNYKHQDVYDFCKKQIEHYMRI